MMALGSRVKQRRLELNLTQSELASKIGVQQGAIGLMERRDQKTTEHATKIASALGVRLEWLLTGEEPKEPLRVYAYDIDAYDDVSEVSSDHTLIPLYDINLSAGNGATGYDFVETRYRLPFRIDWLKSEGVNRQYVKMMRVQGDSMFPVLGDGDKVLVDIDDTTIKNNKVYALVIGDEVFVKRLRKTYNGGLDIISDNSTEFDKITIPPEDLNYVKVIGRVFHKLGNTGL